MEFTPKWHFSGTGLILTGTSKHYLTTRLYFRSPGDPNLDYGVSIYAHPDEIKIFKKSHKINSHHFRIAVTDNYLSD
jgi:hypothetical protein